MMQNDPIAPFPLFMDDNSDDNSDAFPSLDGLPPILPGFFIPPLTDKPQNPIMENLNSPPLDPLGAPIPPITRVRSTLPSINQSPPVWPTAPHILWSGAAVGTGSFQNQVLSWDQLRPSHPTLSTSGPFLSEQDSMVFSAARFHVQTRLAEPSVDIIYVSYDALIKALQMTILGASSIYHTWDTSSENFVVLGLEPGRMGVILVDGKDETISNSFISRFLVIGTSMRRLEILLIDLRTRSAQEGPTIHAFAHALSMVLSFLRDALTRCSLDYPTQSEPSLLSSIWMRYREYEEFLLEFAHLYSREIEKLPSEYPSIDSSPITLLSRIYDHLNLHLERRSPKLITAILGYVLTTTSHEYFQHVASAAGFNAQISHQEHPVLSGRVQESTDIWDDGEDAPKGYSNAGNQVEIYPDFFPRELVDILPAAQKSLVLLRAAQPDHPLLIPPPSPRTIKWFWTLAEIEQAWSELPSQSIDKIIPSSESQAIQAGASQLYKTELEELQVFDLEPGLHLTQSQAFPGNTFNPIPKFIDTFPQLLPSIAPTLLHLTSLVFKPLLDYAALLSGTLLSLFLSDTGPLNFKGHLRLLRSYLLLTSPHFKSRLSEALFSGSDDPHDEGAPGKSSLKSLRRKPEKKPGPNTQPWAVGLSPALLERETWPPVGADLSFFLRTVIVDSLDSTKFVIEDGLNPGRKNVAEEAEYRLGFALRDLPTGSGKDNWLNPLAIEALDFLYMDYKPPHPVDVLITPETLSKYQRIFTFLLRLIRVQHALQSLFRLTRPSSTPLFPTLTSSQKLLVHFRFIAQSFVSALSEYIFDTAIGGNFDFFIAKLSQHPAIDGMYREFTDVFTLAESHSLLLDDILSACLLRSGQRSVGDLLRQALELALELTIVVGELARGRMKEYEAAPAVEELFHKFCAKMSTFSQVLRGLDGGSATSSAQSIYHSISTSGRQPTGGASALPHLLLRLDLGNWWCDAKLYRPRQD